MTAIGALLEAAGLPTSDLVSSRPQFIVACENGDVIGAGALQTFGSAALLRSLAVASRRRSEGLGRRIVQELERIARAAHLRRVILLTQTARGFFEHQGYRVIDRDDVPGEVQASEEFRSLCPASATCMAKQLNAS